MQFPVALMTECLSCVGRGCGECRGGKVPLLCRGCGVWAYYRHPLSDEPLCPGCLYACALCSVRTAEDDRLPFAPGGWVHVACAARRSLESSEPSEHNECSDERASARAYERTSIEREDDRVPKPSERLNEYWRIRGYVTTLEAVRLTGHPYSTIYHWIAEGRLKSVRSGTFHFVSLANLEDLLPQARRMEVER